MYGFLRSSQNIMVQHAITRLAQNQEKNDTVFFHSTSSKLKSYCAPHTCVIITIEAEWYYMSDNWYDLAHNIWLYLLRHGYVFSFSCCTRLIVMCQRSQPLSTVIVSSHKFQNLIWDMFIFLLLSGADKPAIASQKAAKLFWGTE